MAGQKTGILGYAAYTPATGNIFCIGDACIVLSSKQAVRDYIKTFDVLAQPYEIGKVRYRAMRDLLMLGAAYCLDRKAYARFRSLALDDGMDVPGPRGEDRPTGDPMDMLLRVDWVGP